MTREGGLKREGESPHQAYPAPTIVVGLGRFGLRVLEQLGDDWSWLNHAAADPSIENLRLLHVKPNDEQEFHPDWRASEESTTRVARFVGEGDFPSRALEFCVLRSIGLIRYRNGAYQIGIPHDAGVETIEEEAEGPDGESAGSTFHYYRRRFFEWRTLSRDPMAAVERLRELLDHSSDLDIFIAPLLNRVTQGFSPKALLACVSRCNAMANGRDPSPWDWISEVIEPVRTRVAVFAGMVGIESPDWDSLDLDETVPDVVRVALRRPHAEDSPMTIADWLMSRPVSADLVAGLPQLWREEVQAARLGGTSPPPTDASYPDGATHVVATLEESNQGLWLPRHSDGGAIVSENVDDPLLEFAPSPVPGWAAWVESGRQGEQSNPRFDVRVPVPFFPTKRDVYCPVDPRRLLAVDWSQQSWTVEGDRGLFQDRFITVPTSLFRLGFFDHDEKSSGVDPVVVETLERRLSELSVYVHRGLIRMWMDLQRQRMRVDDVHGTDREQQAALQQSIEILGELLVRPLLQQPAMVDGQDDVVNPSVLELPVEASPFLRGLRRNGEDDGVGVDSDLERRLEELGLGCDSSEAPGGTQLFREITLKPREVRTEPNATSDGHGRFLELRENLNEVTRELLEFGFLTTYRHKPTRQSPRLTVFVVSDMSECFSRASTRAVLRELHAELLRAFGPLFSSYRVGFDRSLSIVPILWMPQPSDPFSGKHLANTRSEEAAILDAIHGVRRWIESIPAEVRCISQVFVNGRVTDNAVLSIDDAAQQTRDFLHFQLRNDLAVDPWLRETAHMDMGGDLFSSFACIALEFPAERAREYLANRLARSCVALFEERDFATRFHDDTPKSVEPPESDDLCEDATTAIREDLAGVAKDLADRIESLKENVGVESTAQEIARTFGPELAVELRGEILTQWKAFTGRGARMDTFMEDMRAQMTTQLRDVLAEIRARGDTVVSEKTVELGLHGMESSVEILDRQTRENLEKSDRACRKWERVCEAHSVPDSSGVEAACEAVVECGRAKPDLGPMVLTTMVWSVMGMALAAPLVTAISVALGLNRAPNALEFVLGPMAPWVGALLMGVPLALLLFGYMRFRIRAVHKEIDALAEAVQRVVRGHNSDVDVDRENTASIRSFLESRLRLGAHLFGRAFALFTHEQVLIDQHLVDRVRQSVLLQRQELVRHAESLGVRPKHTTGGVVRTADDVDGLFAKRKSRIEELVPAEELRTFFDARYGDRDQLMRVARLFVREVGQFERWRDSAVLSDTEEILDYGRRFFEEIVTHPISDQLWFTDSVGTRLLKFVSKYYSNLGFGATFSGYEGLDANGIDVLADACLVLPHGLRTVYDDACRAAEDVRTTDTLTVLEKEMIPNAGYMMSLVRNIRAQSIHNLQRFESFVERTDLPCDGTFPLSAEDTRSGAAAVGILTGNDVIRQEILANIEGARSRGDSKPATKAPSEEDG
jgi:hypothetical protein